MPNCKVVPNLNATRLGIEFTDLNISDLFLNQVRRLRICEIAARFLLRSRMRNSCSLSRGPSHNQGESDKHPDLGRLVKG